jgi:hypothetical protein
MSFLATTRSMMLASVIGLAGIATVSTTAVAEPVVKLDVDDARIVRLSAQASTLVVSNPMFADASIQGDKLVVIGKNTGRTKIIVLDLDGNQIANLMVKVQRAEDQVVSVYRSGVRRSYTCEPFCDQPLIVNDDHGHYKEQNDEISGKTAHSTGAAATGSGAQ